MTATTAAANPSALGVTVADELTIQTAAEQKAVLLAALDGTERLELDLSAVHEIDTAGLQVLLALFAEAQSAGKVIELVNAGQPVLDVLELAQLTEALPIRPAVAERPVAKSGKENRR